MFNTGTAPKLVKTKCLHIDILIIREDKLHIIRITDSFVESLAFLQVLLKSHPIKMDVVPDDFQMLQEEILRIDFLKVD